VAAVAQPVEARPAVVIAADSLTVEDDRARAQAAERELIRARTGEGRKHAKERGVRFGRPPKLTPHQRAEALQRLANGETQADVARTYAVDPTTIGRLEAAAAGE
jgi:DNA invertase Pin-like site-specific DNA recombinase